MLIKGNSSALSPVVRGGGAPASGGGAAVVVVNGGGGGEYGPMTYFVPCDLEGEPAAVYPIVNAGLDNINGVYSIGEGESSEFIGGHFAAGAYVEYHALGFDAENYDVNCYSATYDGQVFVTGDEFAGAASWLEDGETVHVVVHEVTGDNTFFVAVFEQRDGGDDVS